MIDPTGLLLIDRSDRERMTLSGADRAKFLHNYCTNDIKGLSAGHGREAFVTSPQGKTIGYLTALAGESDLLLRTDPGGWSLVLPHFAKYGVFDDVSWEDARESTFELHLMGERSGPVLASPVLPSPGTMDLDHTSGSLGETPLRVIRESPLGLPGFTLIGPLADRDRILGEIARAGGRTPTPVSPDEAEGLRILAGTPRFGSDVTPENLPQEIGRDRLAISFVKGCYLGQETVARLDALGHVNKILRVLLCQTDVPPRPGTALLSGEIPAGAVTSSGHSPFHDLAVAMAMVRVKQATAGSAVSWIQDGTERSAIVVDVPTR